MGLCAWLMPALAQAPAQLEFHSFHKQRELSGDPHEFASTQARTLWEHVTRSSRGTSEPFASMLKEGGAYAPVGDGCYLILYAAIQYACLDSTEIEELTPWYPPGNTEVLSVRPLPSGSWWALVKTSNLSRGALIESYHALLANRASGRIVVKGHRLAWAETPGDDKDETCSERGRGARPVPTVILSHAIQAGRGGDEVAFKVENSDCRTGRTQSATQRFAVGKAGVRRLR